MKRCFGGYGFDRHVFALRYHGMMNNISVRSSLKQPGFTAINFYGNFIFIPFILIMSREDWN